MYYFGNENMSYWMFLLSVIYILDPLFTADIWT